MNYTGIKKTLLTGALAAFAFTTIPASAAHADPPGCTDSVFNFYLDSSGVMHLFTEGDCFSSAYRVLNAEVKQDISWQPDPVALSGADADATYYYWATASGCDNNNVATYYGRVFFSGDSNYDDDTSHNDWDVC